MKVTRHRHGAKRYTRKVLNESTDFSLGAGAGWKEPLWQYLTISTHTDDGGESLVFEFNRAEVERIVKQFAEYPGARHSQADDGQREQRTCVM